jgi:hypothetical protein
MSIKQIVEIPLEDFQEIRADLKESRANQQKIIGALEGVRLLNRTEYLTAQEFMDAVKIKRWKFNQLRDDGDIQVIQKGKKLYVSSTEVRRYFQGEME